MLSPVCTPTGSKFSMEHTVMAFPALSRMTSNSISFQPAMHFSTSTWVIGESAAARGDFHELLAVERCRRRCRRA
jgi:hypothetical protein